MPWARLDDSFDGHPKVMRAGNAAAGLFARLVAYSSRLLTDGHVPHSVLTAYGTKPQIDKLVKVGMLHRAGHECPRCPQPSDADVVIHDYLQWNRSRSKVMADREREALKKANQRNGAASTQPVAAANRDRIEDESKTNQTYFGDESSPNRSPDSQNAAGQGQVSPGDSRPHARNSPSKLDVLPTEVPQQRASERVPVPEGIPVWAVPLVDQLTAEGFVVSWDLGFVDWDRVRLAIDKSGIPALVQHVKRRNASAKTPAYSARAWLRDWSTLPTLNAGAAIEPLAVLRAAPPSTELGGDEHMARFLARSQGTLT